MRTTAAAGRFLRSLPEPIAADLCDAIRAAVARDPVSGPGVRAIFPGLMWRLEFHNCQLTFGLVDGEPMIVTARIVLPKAPRPRRPPRKKGASR